MHALLPTSAQVAHAGLVALLAAACLVGVTAMVLRTRPRERRVAMVLSFLLVLCTASILLDTGQDAPAPPRYLLTVTQTTTMAGLAPDVAPVPISGRVVNRGDDRSYVAAVRVRIVSVTTRSGAPSSGCGAADYRLTDARMPVGRTLEPGASASFTGASIGFGTTTRNQDACQAATVHLLYTASTS